MALTSTEEALVRQLIDQQAAILSLAGSESTIISKLGATKVTIADLTSASVIGDADLFLIRQGTTEKNVAGAVVKALASASVAGATETTSGIVELATAAETQTGTDNSRAVHPAGVKAAIDAAAANKALINALNAWTKAQAPATAALADGSVINWDCSNIQVATVTIYGNRTMAAPSAVQPGALYLLRVTQDPTGSRLLAWDSAFKFGSAGAPTLTTTAGKTDFLSFIGGAGNTLEFLGYRLNGV